MKFLGTFVVYAIVIWGFLFFGGAMIFSNLFALILFLALVLTILTKVFGSLWDALKELQNEVIELKLRCKTLENTLDPNRDAR